jgi:hypothetical protein
MKVSKSRTDSVRPGRTRDAGAAANLDPAGRNLCSGATVT